MLDLPRFVIIRYESEHDYWSVCSTRATYEEANEEFARLRGKGTENLYLAGLAFIAGPGDRPEQA